MCRGMRCKAGIVGHVATLLSVWVYGNAEAHSEPEDRSTRK
jgi:hypothetical protein